MKAGIYLIANIVNCKVYVGRSKTLRARQNEHFRELRDGTHQNPRLQNAWNTYGETAFHYAILEYCEIDALLVRETWWVNHLGSMNRARGYNLRTPDTQTIAEETRMKISEKAKGRKLSPETIAKIVAAHRGSKQTDETKAKISRALKGRAMSEEAKAKLSATTTGRPGTWIGRTHSEEAKAKMSAYHKGKTLSEAHRQKLSASLLGNQRSLGVRPSEETRAKIAAAGRGRQHSEETKRKMSIARKSWHQARQLSHGFTAAE